MSSKGSRKATKRRAGARKKRTAKVRAKTARPTRRRVSARTGGTPSSKRVSRPRMPARKASAGVSRPRAAKPKAVDVKVVKPKPVPASPRMLKLRAMLEGKRAELMEQIKRAREESLDVDRTSFAEVGDLVSASVEKEKAFEHGEAGVHALREIAGALEKLKEGTYGICEKCAKPIGVRRLEAMPHARLCVKCKTTEESSGKAAPTPAENAFED
jgi:DnaK suppressor protein